MQLRRFYLSISIIWTVLLTLSCLIPPSGLDKLGLDALFQFDKLLHLIVFAFLTLLWGHAKPSIRSSSIQLVILILASIGLGMMIELVQQSSLIGRSFEWLDLVADTFGSALGVILLRIGLDLDPFVKKRLPFIN